MTERTIHSEQPSNGPVSYFELQTIPLNATRATIVTILFQITNSQAAYENGHNPVKSINVKKNKKTPKQWSCIVHHFQWASSRRHSDDWDGETVAHGSRVGRLTIDGGQIEVRWRRRIREFLVDHRLQFQTVKIKILYSAAPLEHTR